MLAVSPLLISYLRMNKYSILRDQVELLDLQDVFLPLH